MRASVTSMLGIAIAWVGISAQAQMMDPIASVETPMGLARIEDEVYPLMGARLVVGDRTVVEPNIEGAQQVVWIEAEVGSLLLVGRASVGNGCYTDYVWVHTAPEEDLRTSDPFGTCTGIAEITHDAETVTVLMGSMNPDEGMLEYVYDGQRVTERVLGMAESHSGPEASARNWIGHYPSELFAASDWREPLVSLIGEEAYNLAQDILDLSDGEGMQLSEGWVSGLMFGHRDSGGNWGAVAINDDDRRLLVVLGREGEAPRFWGDPRGPLPQPIVEAISRTQPR